MSGGTDLSQEKISDFPETGKVMKNLRKIRFNRSRAGCISRGHFLSCVGLVLRYFDERFDHQCSIFSVKEKGTGQSCSCLCLLSSFSCRFTAATKWATAALLKWR